MSCAISLERRLSRERTFAPANDISRYDSGVRVMQARSYVRGFILLSLCGLCALGQQQDISIDHIEFVQVAQDHDNSVPLVAGKSTVVRVFLRSIGIGPQ